MAPYLTVQLIIEILSKLPVKPLLRFRCVSKTWCEIIDDPIFIKTHFKKSNHQTLILKEAQIHCVDFPGLTRAVEMAHPLKNLGYMVEVLGSCDGLVVLQIGEEEGTVVYNPATKKHRVLPISPVQYPHPELHMLTWIEMFIYGFGYDYGADDYKLVRIVQFSAFADGFYLSEVKFYSVKSNCWKKVRGLPTCYTLVHRKGWGVYVHGCLHWVVKDKSGSNSIISFDFGSEEFEVVKRPEGCTDEAHLTLGVLGGCLFALCNYAKVRTEVWVMEEYRVKDSWRKLFTVEQPGIVGSFNFVRPLAYSSDGTKVLLWQDAQRFFWFDVKRGTAESVSIRDMPMVFDTACMMVESLVPIDAPKRRKPYKKRYLQPEQAGSLLATLPTPLLFNILSRLPADNLLQLRCACKTWNDIVDEPEFATLHLKVSEKSSESINLIITEEKLHMIDLHRLHRRKKAVKLNNPLTCPQGQTEISGSCNGLVCVYDGDMEFAIWNPLTGQYRRIPIIKFQSDIFPNFYVHGFGYDPFSNDYKVVRFVMAWDSSTAVEVYALRSKHWRKIGCIPYTPSKYYSGVLVNESLHWIAKLKNDPNSSSDTIMAFDIRSEKCSEVPLPHNIDVSKSFLGALGESLCLVDSGSGVSDFWVLRNYKLQFWYKMFSIGQHKPIEFSKRIIPLAYSTDGKEVLLEIDFAEFVWYNLEAQTVTHVNINGLPERFLGVVFRGSLLDPNSVGDNYKMAEKEVERSSADLGVQEDRCKRGINKAVKDEPQSKKGRDRDGLDGFLSKGFKLKL